MIWSLDCKQFRPETPILNNWDLIKFLLLRISPIPTQRGGRGMKQNLTEFNVAISWIMLSKRNWCLMTQFFNIYMHFSNQVQRHQKLSAFIIYEIQKLRNIPPFLQKQFLESGYDETKGNLVKALLCKPWSNLGPFKPNCVEYFLNLNCTFWMREHHLEPCLKLFLWDQKLSFFSKS